MNLKRILNMLMVMFIITVGMTSTVGAKYNSNTYEQAFASFVEKGENELSEVTTFNVIESSYGNILYVVRNTVNADGITIEFYQGEKLLEDKDYTIKNNLRSASLKISDVTMIGGFNPLKTITLNNIEVNWEGVDDLEKVRYNWNFPGYPKTKLLSLQRGAIATAYADGISLGDNIGFTYMSIMDSRNKV